MDLSTLSIRRPVLSVVMSLLLVVFGVIGFTRLPVREFPAVDPPVVSVQATYPGASPEVIDAQITEPLERAVNGIAGVRNISSTSREGQSRITVEFRLDTDLDTAANDVRDKVAQAVRSLPPDADPPVVEKADADSDPIIMMTLSSETRDRLALSEIADTTIRERLQTIPGVSTIRIWGEQKAAMRLWLDPEKMAAHGVTPLDVRAAVERQNVDLPAGTVEGRATELGVRTEARLDTPEEFEALVLRTSGERQVRLRDIGWVELGPENPRQVVWRSGVPMIGIAIVAQPNTNAVEISDEFHRRIERIRADLPKDVTLDVGYDFTTFVRRSIAEVKETLLVAFLLVVAIIWLFLRDWRSTIIPVIAIPVSIIPAFFLMDVLGFSLNVLTLVAIVLAIGLVCDDAIVVLENIYTKVEAGTEPIRAAVEGSREIFFAVISTTLTLATVFLPVVFLEGLTGRLFREFGLSLMAAVLFSAFVALSLTPMMCSRMLRRQQHGLLHRLTEPFFRGLTSLYRVLLRGALAARWLAVPIVGGVAYGISHFWGALPRELAPLEDRSNIRVNLRAPEGASFEYTAHQVEKVATWVDESIPEASRAIAGVAIWGNPSNGGIINLFLTEPTERTRSQIQIFQQISDGLADFDGLRVTPSQPPTIGSRRGAGQPVQFVIQAPSLPALTDALPKFLDAAGKNPSLRFADSDFKLNRPQLTLRIDRVRAAELGIDVADVARTVQIGLGGQRLGFFLRDGRQFQVIGQLAGGGRDEPGDLRRLFVRSRSGAMVSLDNVVSVSENASPSAIFRFDRFVAATVSSGLGTNASLGDGIAAMRQVASNTLPPGFTTALTGQSRDFVESSSSLLYAFLLALLLIYLFLAAQFESFIDPVIILLTVPLSLAGALASLHFAGMTLNVFSQIGIIMLVGLVTKNGILIVEFANQRKAAGLDLMEAALDASVARFRPILMTSLSTVLGILPIALSLGASAGSRQSLGVAVVGGLVFSTFLTLFIIPAMYVLLSRKRATVLVDVDEPAPMASPRTAGT